MSAPVNDDLANAAIIHGVTPTATVDVTDATTQTGEDLDLPGEPGDVAQTAWYEYTPQTDGHVTFTTAGSDITDTTLQAFHQTGGDVTFNSLTEVASNDDTTNNWAAVDFDVTAGQHYYIQAGVFEADQGGITLAQTDGPEGAPACYLRGTHILTPQGAAAIEDLSIGDSIATVSGAHRAIKWIGRRSYAAASGQYRPIRIAAGALGDNIPARDLHVSPRHGMLLDGLLIEARWLLNGATITQPARSEDIHYFHIELDSHDALIAEGAASESFLGSTKRHRFDNGAEFAARYPHERPNPFARAFAPHAANGFAFQAVRDRLAAIARIPADSGGRDIVSAFQQGHAA